MNLGENIYKCRTANHLSQGDLAVELEVSREQCMLSHVIRAC